MPPNFAIVRAYVASLKQKQAASAVAVLVLDLVLVHVNVIDFGCWFIGCKETPNIVQL